MVERISVGFRVLGTGLSFLCFGLGGLTLRVLVFPALSLMVHERDRRVAMARDLIRWAFRAFIGLMCGLGVLRYEIKGLDKLDRRGLLILANHPTLIDTVFLMALVRRADCIVKSALWNNPFTRGPVRAADYISNESGPELVDACVASLAHGNNLIVFPEGTRTPRTGGIQLKRGAANIAIRGRVNVTPIVIRCTPSTLGRGDKWWKVPPRRVSLSIVAGDDINIAPFISSCDNEVLAARRLTEHLQEYFSKESHAVA